MIAAIRLLIFTGARLSEIIGLRWEHVDITGGLAMLADSKTGPKPVYLNAPAISLLAGLPRVEGNPYVTVGGKTGTSLADWRWRRSAASCASP